MTYKMFRYAKGKTRYSGSRAVRCTVFSISFGAAENGKNHFLFWDYGYKPRTKNSLKFQMA